MKRIIGRIPKRPTDTQGSGHAAAAADVAAPWAQARYYEDAEPFTDLVWEHVRPYLEGCDFSVVCDLAAGHGRNSTKLLPLAGHLYIVDVHEENVESCRRRFGEDRRITYVHGDGLSLAALPAETVTLVFCFDAMVHFDSDTVRAYLREFGRVLRAGGRAFCHHSNYTGNPAGHWQRSPHWRNFMSAELFTHYAAKERLRVLRSDRVDWARDGSDLDCYTLLERPA